MKRATVLIYTKPPFIGVSKTRLARSLGSPVLARRIASMTLARTVRAATHASWKTRLYIAPDRANCALWPAHLPRFSQGCGDLTARLSKGFSEAPPGPVLFIGADAPDISTGLIRQAIRKLQTHDAVFGPARDGGFWLFGLHTSAHTPPPFSNVRWSGPHAMADVRANLPAKAKVACLPELTDIDTAKDWADWHRR